MNRNQLRYFVSAAEHRRFTKAAEQYYICLLYTSYKTLEKPKSKWHIHGWFCLIGCYLLMMYYTTVSGWMVSYFGRFLTCLLYTSRCV